MPVGCCCVGGLARQRGVREAGCGLLAWLQATLHVSHLKQGFERGELDLLNEKGVKVGTAKVGACDGTTASQLACCAALTRPVPLPQAVRGTAAPATPHDA